MIHISHLPDDILDSLEVFRVVEIVVVLHVAVEANLGIPLVDLGYPVPEVEIVEIAVPQQTTALEEKGALGELRVVEHVVDDHVSG